VASDTASWLRVCASRYDRFATLTISSVNLIQSASVTGASRPFSQRRPGRSINCEASASAAAAFSISGHPV
jgi:hypothetical protein